MADDLPPVLRAIAEVAGEDAALTIARVHGGTRVTVPRRDQGDNWLTRLIADPGKVGRIIDALGGPAQRVDVPIGPEGGYLRSRRERARRYVELRAGGASEREVARALGITGRAVRKRRAKERGPDLFS